MNKEQRLKKIIEIALRRGWNGLWDYTDDAWYKSAAECDGYGVIFSHDFLKAYFGEEEVLPYPIWRKMVSWEFHAINLVLAKDRIDYLWENRPEEYE